MVPFRGEPYLQSRVGAWTGGGPIPARACPKTISMPARLHRTPAYRTPSGRADRGERYPLRVIREVVLRCGETRGRTAFHAAAAAIDGHGVLVAGPSGAGKTTVLAALAAHRRADLSPPIGRCSPSAADFIGVPLSIRIAGGTLSALTPREALPSPRVLPRTSVPLEGSCTPRDFAAAFASRVRESAPLRLVSSPTLRDDDPPFSIQGFP